MAKWGKCKQRKGKRKKCATDRVSVCHRSDRSDADMIGNRAIARVIFKPEFCHHQPSEPISTIDVVNNYWHFFWRYHFWLGGCRELSSAKCSWLDRDSGYFTHFVRNIYAKSVNTYYGTYQAVRTQARGGDREYPFIAKRLHLRRPSYCDFYKWAEAVEDNLL